MIIKLEHLTRIEGHAHLNIDASTGEVRECRLDVFETPRFFEAILLGQKAEDVAPLVSRICGICSHSHSLVSLAATENAAGIEISKQSRGLRQLLILGELIQSHIVHLYFMALPDYLGIEHIFEPEHRDLLNRAMRLKKMGSEICRIVGGRAIHPLSLALGGFSMIPDMRELRNLRDLLVEGLSDLAGTVERFRPFNFEGVTRACRWARIAGDGHSLSAYPLFGDKIESNGDLFRVADYKSYIQEFLPEHSHAKHALLSGDDYRVGPLVRVAIGFDQLSDMAKKAARALAFTPDLNRPMGNVPARLIEVIHSVEESIQIINNLLVAGVKEETLPDVSFLGEGVAAIEAPRGTLYHAYRYEDNRLVHADCIIPTAQNLSAIDADLRFAAPTLIKSGEEQMKQALERLVRAYDPCISCSTHMMKITVS